MKYILTVLLALGIYAFAKEKVSKNGRSPASEIAHGFDLTQIRPSMVVNCNNEKLGDEPEHEDACWHFAKKDEHPSMTAVGQLFAGTESRCTATVITPPNCSDPSKVKPKVITNGHCSLKHMGGFSMKFNGLKGVAEADRPEISMTKIYSTENRTDVGVYELDTTYDQLPRFGVKPVKIASSMGELSYTNLTMPLQKVEEANRNMRISGNCVPEKQTTMIDQYRFYTGVTSFKNCSAVGGSSGSGLFNSAGELTGLMVAGTLAEAAKPPQHECSIDTCIYDGQGTPTRYETNFGFDITHLNNCFEGCEFNFNATGPTGEKCRLPDPASSFGTVITIRDPVWTTSLANSINFRNRKFSKLHVKMCMDAITCSCQDENGYKPGPTGTLREGVYGYNVKPSDYLPAGAQVKAVVGEPAKFQFLCIRGETPDGKLDDLKNTTNYPQWLYNKGSPFLKPDKPGPPVKPGAIPAKTR